MERKISTCTFVIFVIFLIARVRGQEDESDDDLKFYECMANCIGHDNYQIYDQCIIICGTFDFVPLPSPGLALGPASYWPAQEPFPGPSYGEAPVVSLTVPSPSPVPVPVSSSGPAPVPSSGPAPVPCQRWTPGVIGGVHRCIRGCYRRSYFTGKKDLNECKKECRRKGSLKKCVKKCEADCGKMNIMCRTGCGRKCDGSKSHP